MGVIESELIAAVMAYGHGQVSQVHNLDLVRMAGLGAVGVVASMDGGQGSPDNRVGAVRCHNPPIGTSWGIA
ncbi:MAG: hypothetical protein LH645_06610 [Actinomycetia bacterium]|nr:hypothetical protein [Actinomycetes bacterium]